MRVKGERPGPVRRRRAPARAPTLASDPAPPAHPPLPHAPVVPAPLALPGFRYAPDCEAAVAALFAALAPRLGYTIEKIQTRFPDCIALRRVNAQTWQRVRIEFEFESRNFDVHGHDPRACDILVCWRHNWPQCPPTLEVLALEPLLNPA